MPLAASPTFPSLRTSSAKSRLAAMFTSHYELVWRVVRRFGVPEHSADDAAQQVFLVAAERLADIIPASERSFLYGTAIRTARTFRRRSLREPATDTADEHPASGPHPEELTAKKQARQLLDAILEAMPEELRSVFILHELENLTMREIADILEIPGGTVASRLRRAREQFRVEVANHTGQGQTGPSGANDE